MANLPASLSSSSSSSSSSSAAASSHPASPSRQRAPGSQRPPTNMETFQMLALLLPKVPLAIRVAIMHILRLSVPAPYIDLRSELIVAITRSFLDSSRPWSVTAAQKASMRDPGVKGRIWVSTYASPVPPETSLRGVLLDAIEDLRDKTAPKPRFRAPELAAVEAEWTGYRAKAERDEPMPSMSEVDKYREMNDECSHPTTVLYFHGGAYYLCDPSSHRPTTKKLAKMTGGRCYSVRYRLAPQHPFPAALLDALVSYFTLLYPPPDAYHEPVAPEHIVFAGDSAGGNLAFSLMALLLHLRKTRDHILWHGQEREIPLPAAMCGISPWVDITQSATMWEGHMQAPFDYLPKPGPVDWHKYPPCDLWPAVPNRQRVFVDDDLAAHPLASIAMYSSWAGCPPVYLCTGWELLSLEDRWLARQLARDGVTVLFEEYEAMPHVFALILAKTANADRCYEVWADFVKQATEGQAGKIEGKARRVSARTLENEERDFEELCEVGEDEMRERIRALAAPEGVEAKL